MYANAMSLFFPLCFTLGIKNCVPNWRKSTVDPIFNDIYSSNTIADKHYFPVVMQGSDPASWGSTEWRGSHIACQPLS